MILALFFSLVTIFVLMGLVAFIDSSLEIHWGVQRSFLKAFLLLFSFLSALYQIGFLFHFPLLFSLIDILALLVTLIFYRPIAHRLKQYYIAIIHLPKKGDKGSFSIFVLLLFYTFVLAIFSVPGLNWDSMIFELSRPFLFLNEGTVFTPHYSDARQVAWPMGFDLLLYLFTRHGGETIGVGLLSFLFYIAILIGIYSTVSEKKDTKTALTLVFGAASLPLFLYCASSDKSDTAITFSLLMMWLSYQDFQKSRQWTDFYLLLLALAFGLTCKLSFLLLGGFSLVAFLILELKNGSLWQPLKGPKLSWMGLLFFGCLWLLLSQSHLYIHNILTLGYLEGDATTHVMTPKQGWMAFLQTFFKYHLMFVDFVVPLSTVHIPFVDTFLSFIYNHTLAPLTGDKPWSYHYFPDEMRASFGPLGLFILWGLYKTCFKKENKFSKAVGWVSLSYLVLVSYKFPWTQWPAFRYLLPVIVLSFALLPTIHHLRFWQYTQTIRWFSLLLLLFCSTINYPKPLMAYHPKAIPWYRHAFTDRGFRYRQQYFDDNRMEIYRQLVQPGDRVLILATLSTWTYPYYQYAWRSSVRLADYLYRRSTWDNRELKNYDWIICNGRECVEEFEAKKDTFQLVWRSSLEIYRQGAFLQPKP